MLFCLWDASNFIIVYVMYTYILYTVECPHWDDNFFERLSSFRGKSVLHYIHEVIVCYTSLAVVLNISYNQNRIM